MTLVVVLVLVELWLLLLARRADWRAALVGAAVLWSLVLLALSEALSLGHAFARVPLFAAWALLALALGWPLRRAWPRIAPALAALAPRGWRIDVTTICLGVPLALTLVVAVVAPPNTTDSLTYHMGRVAGWLDQRSLAHFATHVERQVGLGPFAEIVIANLQALAGGDRYANLVQWFAFAGAAVGASLLVRELGGDAWAQKLGALLALTTPMAIAQATSTQNDLVCAFFVVAAAWQCLTLGTAYLSGLALGATVGLAALTKSTAPVFLAPFGLWAGYRLWSERGHRRALAVLLVAGAVALAVNAPHGLRNHRLYGSPVGMPWLAPMVGNQIHGLGPTFSNLVRNAASHIALPLAGAPAAVQATVDGLHRAVGLDANDPRTTCGGRFFAIGFHTHEDASANALQLVLFVAAAALLAWRGTRAQRWFWLLLLAGSVLFSASFKWQPWGSRLELPFFMLAAVPTALAARLVLSPRWGQAMAVALVVAATPWLLANQTRALVPGPYLGRMLPRSDIWQKPRGEQYFVNRPMDYRPFVAAAERLRALGCGDVGVLGDEDSWTYPLHVFLREAGVRLRPYLVRNPTAALARPGPEPCALVSLAFGRVRGPEDGAGGRFELAWHDGLVALYLPTAGQRARAP
jgi:hypothetical protein